MSPATGSQSPIQLLIKGVSGRISRKNISPVLREIGVKMRFFARHARWTIILVSTSSGIGR